MEHDYETRAVTVSLSAVCQDLIAEIELRSVSTSISGSLNSVLLTDTVMDMKLSVLDNICTFDIM